MGFSLNLPTIAEIAIEEFLSRALAKLPKLKTTVRKVKEGHTIIRAYLDTPANIKEVHIRNHAEYIAREMKLSALPAVFTSYKEGSIVIDIPNEDRKMIELIECLYDSAFKAKVRKEIGLPFALGKDNDGKVIVGDLAKAPHLLIAGQSGSGKSVAMRSVIDSLLMAWSSEPLGCQFVFLDPKGVEFINYRDLNTTIVHSTTSEEAINVLQSLVLTMEERYQNFQLLSERIGHPIYNINDYNKVKCEQGLYSSIMCYIVVVIDELSDILLNQDVANKTLLQLTQKARASGIHLVMATQRPSREIISGAIRANVPAKICCKVAQAVDGRVVFGDKDYDAHRLLGSGDMLYIDDTRAEPIRLQGAYASESFLNDYLYYLEIRRQRQNKIVLFSTEERMKQQEFLKRFRTVSFSRDMRHYGQTNKKT